MIFTQRIYLTVHLLLFVIFSFYDKTLSPEMILFYIVVCIAIFLEIYVYKNNKPLIYEDGLFKNLYFLNF
ncbi:hypothetical protein CNEO3_230041 [Clostridium neonatale]|uniref:Uncharacterized protein n=1 Tax=Clostridium neonatale TaxID=137838 RepID=A0AA86MRH0_9CLOT|nr:conserved hypothetical protein [Clostridium neonatale]CAI3549256.1 hypothetical protein CNEO3_200008 [Clostridium neonatale]CAI3580591.1 hypothetical protein CNEO4_40017 [Clostridium neonatale]CAI3600126.1 hypothetical protein CNEO3_230041 [Clostridium neonatale]CAI3609840.1 hypothetical protein CNEO3_190031 [Clostridium neonatale]